MEKGEKILIFQFLKNYISLNSIHYHNTLMSYTMHLKQKISKINGDKKILLLLSTYIIIIFIFLLNYKTTG